MNFPNPISALRWSFLLIAALVCLGGPAWAQELHGVKIYYSDRVVKIPALELTKGWAAAPDDDVQVVIIYYHRQGDSKLAVDELSAHDFYWWSPSKGFGQTNEVSEIPQGATYKRGKWMYPDEAFLKLYNEAHNDRDF